MTKQTQLCVCLFAALILSFAMAASAAELPGYSITRIVPPKITAPAADLPELVIPQGVGVNIHFTRGHEKDLDLIAAAGFKFIRMDLSWGGTERKKGEYNWASYDELTANLEQRGIRALYILDYSNPLYEETVVSTNPITGKQQRDLASPQHPESVAAFARWAAAAAQHFKGRRVIWEIWNEPNISFWKPKPDVQQYSTLALATCQAIREVDPQATIVGPATSEVPAKFLEEFFKSGALEHLDAVSVHPYRSPKKPPETAADDYLKLRALIEKYAPPGKKQMPILSGEWGYSTHTKGVSLDTQAAFIARQQLVNLLNRVPISIWYDWKNDGPDPKENEHNFGTVTPELQPKPSYVALQTLTRELSGYRIARRLSTTNASEYVLLFVNDRDVQKLAAWTADAPRTIAVACDLTSLNDLAAVDGQGQPVRLKLAGGQLVFELGAAPTYITFKKRSRQLAVAAAWQFVGPMRTLVTAGRQGTTSDSVDLPVAMTNPLEQPARVKLNMAGPGSAGRPWGDGTTKQLELAPGQKATNNLDFAIAYRSAQTCRIRVSVKFEELAATGKLRSFETTSETLDFLVANPLKLTLAPVETGVHLHVQNPSRDRFVGRAVINREELPLRLDGVAEVTVKAPQVSIDSPVTVQLMEGTELPGGGRPASEPVTVRFHRLPLASLKAVLDGEAKVPANASLVETNAPGGEDRPFVKAFRLDYRFDAGWRFVRCVPEAPKSVQLSGRPTSLGVWVYGDASDNVLRMRVTDESGQTFQPNGPELKWTGWRWVEFDLANLQQAGHWGGADDGVARGKLKLDTLLLVDGSRSKTAGTLYFAGPALVFQ